MPNTKLLCKYCKNRNINRIEWIETMVIIGFTNNGYSKIHIIPIIVIDCVNWSEKLCACQSFCTFGLSEIAYGTFKASQWEQNKSTIHSQENL